MNGFRVRAKMKMGIYVLGHVDFLYLGKGRREEGREGWRQGEGWRQRDRG